MWLSVLLRVILQTMRVNVSLRFYKFVKLEQKICTSFMKLVLTLEVFSVTNIFITGMQKGTVICRLLFFTFFLFLNFFIVVQWQLSLRFPHCSAPPWPPTPTVDPHVVHACVCPSMPTSGPPSHLRELLEFSFINKWSQNLMDLYHISNFTSTSHTKWKILQIQKRFYFLDHV